MDENWKPKTEGEARAYLNGALGILHDMLELAEEVLRPVQTLIAAIHDSIKYAPGMAEQYIASLRGEVVEAEPVDDSGEEPEA